MNNLIEALKEIKKESKDFKITLYKKEVLEITKEFDRLNNIINELEKWLEEMKEYDSGLAGTENEKWYYSNVYDYLQELKGSDK